MKSIPAIMIMVTLVVLMCIQGADAQDDMTRVHDTAFENHRRPSVAFEHDTHNETAGIGECGACHHVYSDDDKPQLVEDESSEEQECSVCHLIENQRPPLNLMRAFHLRCKGCHQEQGQGPVICNDCHRGA